MLTSEGRPVREGKCVVCEVISEDCVVYSAPDSDAMSAEDFFLPKSVTGC